MPKAKKTAARKVSHRKKTPPLNLQVKFGREADGEIFAYIPAMPGVAAYAKTRQAALAKVQALALRVIAEELEEGELKQQSINFAVA